MISLEFVSGRPPGSAPYYSLVVREPYTLGRARECDIFLDYGDISQQHASLNVMRQSQAKQQQQQQQQQRQQRQQREGEEEEEEEGANVPTYEDDDDTAAAAGGLHNGAGVDELHDDAAADAPHLDNADENVEDDDAENDDDETSSPLRETDPLVVRLSRPRGGGRVAVNDVEVGDAPVFLVDGAEVQFGAHVRLRLRFRPLVVCVSRAGVNRDRVQELEFMYHRLGATLTRRRGPITQRDVPQPIGLLYATETAAQEDAWCLTALAAGYSVVLPTYVFEWFAALAQSASSPLSVLPPPVRFEVPIQCSRTTAAHAAWYLRPESDVCPFPLYPIPTNATLKRTRETLFAKKEFFFLSDEVEERYRKAVTLCGGEVHQLEEAALILAKGVRKDASTTTEPAEMQKTVTGTETAGDNNNNNVDDDDGDGDEDNNTDTNNNTISPDAVATAAENEGEEDEDMHDDKEIAEEKEDHEEEDDKNNDDDKNDDDDNNNNNNSKNDDDKENDSKNVHDSSPVNCDTSGISSGTNPASATYFIVVDHEMENVLQHGDPNEEATAQQILDDANRAGIQIPVISERSLFYSLLANRFSVIEVPWPPVFDVSQGEGSEQNVWPFSAAEMDDGMYNINGVALTPRMEGRATLQTPRGNRRGTPSGRRHGSTTHQDRTTSPSVNGRREKSTPLQKRGRSQHRLRLLTSADLCDALRNRVRAFVAREEPKLIQGLVGSKRNFFVNPELVDYAHECQTLVSRYMGKMEMLLSELDEDSRQATDLLRCQDDCRALNRNAQYIIDYAEYSSRRPRRVSMNGATVRRHMSPVYSSRVQRSTLAEQQTQQTRQQQQHQQHQHQHQHQQPQQQDENESGVNPLDLTPPVKGAKTQTIRRGRTSPLRPQSRRPKRQSKNCTPQSDAHISQANGHMDSSSELALPTPDTPAPVAAENMPVPSSLILARRLSSFEPPATVRARGLRRRASHPVSAAPPSPQSAREPPVATPRNNTSLRRPTPAHAPPTHDLAALPRRTTLPRTPRTPRTPRRASPVRRQLQQQQLQQSQQQQSQQPQQQINTPRSARAARGSAPTQTGASITPVNAPVGRRRLVQSDKVLSAR